MKNVPRPTASRMTRVWFPGRAMRSTACRSANERAWRSGCTARTSAGAGQMQHEGDRHEPAGQHEADGQRSRLPGRDADQRGGHGHGDAPLEPVEPRRRRGVLPQQQRRLDVADLEQRHDREQHRHEQADGESLQRRRRPSARTRPAAAPRDRRRTRGSASSAAPAIATPSTLPASPSSSTCAM